MVKHMYKVKYGFDTLSSITVEAGAELEKAIYSWLKQTPVAIGGRMINGKHIIDIKPDYHYYTGWYPNYEPSSGDDWKQIERDCPPTLNEMFNAYVDRVRVLINNNQTNLIGQAEPIKLENKPKNTGSAFAQKVLENKQ